MGGKESGVSTKNTVRWAGLMMVPHPLLQRLHPTTQHSRGHNTNHHNSNFFFFFCRGSASEDQTYRCAPVTNHHYISAKHHHIAELTLSRGSEQGGRTGVVGKRVATLDSTFTDDLGSCAIPRALYITPTGRETPIATTLNDATSEAGLGNSCPPGRFHVSLLHHTLIQMIRIVIQLLQSLLRS